MFDRVGRSDGDDISPVVVDLEGGDVGAFEGLDCGVLPPLPLLSVGGGVDCSSVGFNVGLDELSNITGD